MSLKARLTSAQAMPSNVGGCKTCVFLDTLDLDDRRAFDSWLAESKSVAQLWEICVAEGLTVTSTPFRNHVRHHKALE